MKQEFIQYQQALELKELGFDESCLGFYEFGSMDEEWHLRTKYVSKNEYNDVIHILKAPLYQQAFDFFREKYGLWQTVLQNTDIDWTYDILPINGIHDYKLIDVFEEYNEAKQACLEKLIEIVKTKNI
jgi:hypothetical protein